MRTKKSKAIENEMISSETVNEFLPEEKQREVRDVRDVQYIAMLHLQGNYAGERTIYCADRAELDQRLASEKAMDNRIGGARVFIVERDIEW